MRISYQIICDFWSQNKKLLIIWQLVFLLSAAVYLVMIPKTYEAYFHVQTAKILVNDKWDALKWARYTRRNLMSPQGFTPELARVCVGSDSNAARRSLVNAMQIDILNDSGGVLAISVRLVGADHAKECANLLAKNIVDISDAALTHRLLEEGFTPTNLQKGKINNYERAMITSQPRMSDSYVRPQIAQTMLGAFLMGLISVIAYAILKRRYFSE